MKILEFHCVSEIGIGQIGSFNCIFSANTRNAKFLAANGCKNCMHNFLSAVRHCNNHWNFAIGYDFSLTFVFVALFLASVPMEAVKFSGFQHGEIGRLIIHFSQI